MVAAMLESMERATADVNRFNQHVQYPVSADGFSLGAAADYAPVSRARWGGNKGLQGKVNVNSATVKELCKLPGPVCSA